MTHLNKIILITCSAAVILACGTGSNRRAGSPFRFAVICNTHATSPFTGHPEKLKHVFQNINRDNPIMVIHTGNMIQGGTTYMGIKKIDIIRQYRDYDRTVRILRPILHTVAGEKDKYNGSLHYYLKHTGEKLNYSFNYGDVHLVIFNITNRDHQPSKSDLEWLAADLKKHRYHKAILVFIHYPLFGPPRSGIFHPGAEKIHAILTQYPVKAVISGSRKKLYEIEKDSIRYITAGCFGFNYEEPHWNYYQYYLFEFTGYGLTLSAKKGDFPRNSYRPKIYTQPANGNKKK